MKTEPDAITLITKELTPMMRHMLPMLTSLLASLDKGETATAQRLAELQAVMERIATGLEKQTRQLQEWEHRVAVDHTVTTIQSRQIQTLSHRLDREAESRSRLEERIEQLIALLTG